MKTKKQYILFMIIVWGMISCQQDPNIPKGVIFYTHSIEDSIDFPEGAIKGVFSVSDTEQVYFSKGNLQYQASTNTWRFAEHQWDYVGTQIPDTDGNFGGNVNGSDNANISETYNGWIDLFGWGTSGFNHGAINYQPWGTSTNYSDYAAYGNPQCNLYDQSGTADWGYNPILNGGNTENTWRTLTKKEWDYVFNIRNTDSGIRYAMAQVNGVNGVILLPDNWNSFYFELNHTTMNCSSNIISATQWELLEKKGVVFLPVTTGIRFNGASSVSISLTGLYGYYWSSSIINNNSAYNINIHRTGIAIEDRSYRIVGINVRLVYSFR